MIDEPPAPHEAFAADGSDRYLTWLDKLCDQLAERLKQSESQPYGGWDDDPANVITKNVISDAQFSTVDIETLALEYRRQAAPSVALRRAYDDFEYINWTFSDITSNDYDIDIAIQGCLSPKGVITVYDELSIADRNANTAARRLLFEAQGERELDTLVNEYLPSRRFAFPRILIATIVIACLGYIALRQFPTPPLVFVSWFVLMPSAATVEVALATRSLRHQMSILPLRRASLKRALKLKRDSVRMCTRLARQRRRAVTALARLAVAALREVLIQLPANSVASQDEDDISVIPDNTFLLSPDIDASELTGRPSDLNLILTTSISDIILSFMQVYRSGTYALAGERGTGKTTTLLHLQYLLRYGVQRRHRGIHELRDDTEVPPVIPVLWVNSPTRYDERDFILAMLERLAVLIVSVLVPRATSAQRALDVRQQYGYRLIAARWFLAVTAGTAAAVALAALGTWRFSWKFSSATGIIVGIMIVMVTIVFVAGTGLSARFVHAIRILLGWSSTSVESHDNSSLYPTELVEDAERAIDNVVFDRSIVIQSEISAGGIGIGAKQSAQNNQKVRPYTLPGAIAAFRELASRLTDHTGGLVIIIDEIDKMDTDDARQFLRTVKSLFDIDRCFFLISISEDAARVFNERMFSGRSELDSSFDHVFTLERLDFLGIEMRIAA